jgi:hypothetical protein
METFIETSNQTLLWEVMNQCHYFNTMENKDAWFAQHIGAMYEKPQQDNSKTLEEWNKRAIEAMLTDLSLAFQKHIEKRQESVHKQIQQQELGRWVEKDTQLRNDTTKDEPIKNMEELLAETQKRREVDLPRFAVPVGEKV